MLKQFILLTSCLFLFLCTAMAQPKAYPGIHEYIHLDEVPVLLNFHEIRQQIGYPYEAYRQEIQGEVFCRVLVDQKGRCVASLITRSGHPILSKAVSNSLSELTFIPGKRNNKSVASWTNILVVFDLNQAKEFLVTRKRDYFLHLNFVQARKSRKRWRKAEQLLDRGKWEAAELAYEAGNMLYPHVLNPNPKQKQELFSALRGQAWLLIQIGEAAKAAQKLSKAIVWGELLADEADDKQAQLVEAYLLRSEARLAAGEPLAALADCQWILANPESEFSHRKAEIQIGLIRAHIGDYATALNHLQVAIEMDNSDPRPQIYKAKVLMMMGDESDACACLEKVNRDELSTEWDWKAEQIFRVVCQPNWLSWSR